MKINKMLLWLTVGLTLFLCFSFNVAANEIEVYVNEIKIISDVAPCIISDRTMIPARAVCDAIGCEVYWNEAERTVTVTRGNVKSVLTIDSCDALIFEGDSCKKIMLDVPAQIISDRTMVPLRFISESMGAEVQWNENSRTVRISIDLGLSLTLDETVVLNEKVSDLSKPNKIDKCMYGVDWYIYNSDYANYKMVAVKDEKAVGFFTVAKGFKTGFGVEYGMAAKDITISGYTIKIYRDELAGNSVSGILVLDSSVIDESDIVSLEFLNSQSSCLFDMINAFRAANDLPILAWDYYAAVSAVEHSADMAEMNCFSHTGSDDSDVLERYLKLNNVSWSAIGENICDADCYASDILFRLINSQGYRNNILNPDFKYLGTGMSYNYYSDSKYYATQVFVTY